MSPTHVVLFPAEQDLGAPGRRQRFLHTPEVSFQDLTFAAKEGDGPPDAGEGEAEVKERSEKEIRGTSCSIIRNVPFGRKTRRISSNARFAISPLIS